MPDCVCLRQGQGLAAWVVAEYSAPNQPGLLYIGDSFRTEDVWRPLLGSGPDEAYSRRVADALKGISFQVLQVG